MSQYKQNLLNIDTEELEFKIRNSHFTEDAHEEALVILNERGLDTSALPKKPNENASNEVYSASERRANNKETALSIAVLLWSVLLPVIIGGLAALASIITADYRNFISVLFELLLLIFAAWLLKKSIIWVWTIEKKVPPYLKVTSIGASIVLAAFWTLAFTINVYEMISK